MSGDGESRGRRGGTAAFVRRALSRRWVQVYLALLVLSHVVQILPHGWIDRAVESVVRTIIGQPAAAPPARGEPRLVEVPAQRDAGAVPGTSVTLGVRTWDGPAGSDPLPIVLLHGSPSSGADDFARFAPLLNERGFDVVGVSLPGFGGSEALVPSYSIVANARYTLAAMDALGIERAHLAGWSQGGGSVLHAARIAPERVATATLLASIGVQEAEGSGDYYFEHGKYALGFAALVVAPELIPHFGLLGPRALRHAFLRNFWDTDQRPLEGIMRSIETPTLIIQGREDFLVDAWTAERSHDLIGPSRLVMLDAGHFFPVGSGPDSEIAADAMASFLARHDEPGVPVRRGAADLAPDFTEEDPTLGPLHVTHFTPWWLLVLAIVLATFISEDLTVIAVGLLIVSGTIDRGVGLMGCFLGIVIGDYGIWAIGRFAGRRILSWPFFRRVLPEPSLEKWRRIFDRHVAKTVFLSRMLPGTRLPMYLAAGILARRSARFLFWVTIAVAVWTPLLLILTALIGPGLLGFFREIFHGPWAILAAFVVLMVLLRLVEYEATALGRQRLKADLQRLVSPEFWPPWIFYVPVVPMVAWLSLRHRGPMTFTCANPGIANGGGVIGESKAAIAAGFGRDAPEFLHSVLVPAGASPEQRARLAVDTVRHDEGLGGYPVILKPDFAQRGHALKLARHDDDVHAYFQSMHRDAILQRYHPGPHEVGVLWSRVPGTGATPDELSGEIFSITRKVFPVVEGDGRRPLERLIWEHPRFRMQARTFLKRFDAQSDRVLDEGEELRLVVAGNHCQGTMFVDGADLITPELRRRIDAIARSFRDPESGAGIDFGRFDIRCASEDALKRGEGFAIVELNGTLSESTNIYDPQRSVLWAYAVLFRQWRRLFRLGHARRREGVEPLRVRSLFRLIREHYRGRPGSPVSD